MIRLFVLTFFLIFPCLFSNLLLAQTESTPNETPLKVGVVGYPPFSKYQNQTYG